MRNLLLAIPLALTTQLPVLAFQQGPTIPRTWDPAKLETMELPNAATGTTQKHVSPEYYYAIPATTIYKTYPFYHPDYEPEGYFESLLEIEPETTWDSDHLISAADWAMAGEQVFHWPSALNPINAQRRQGLLRVIARSNIPSTDEGIVPFLSYVVREKGKVEVGAVACASCHTRVMPDGSTIIGAQGNNNFGPAQARPFMGLPPKLAIARAVETFGMPEVEGTAPPLPPNMSKPQLIQGLLSQLPGVQARRGTSPFSPVQVPDLIGVKDRRYLDRTGLVRHREIGDLMRYAALNQDLDFLANLHGFIPSVAARAMTNPNDDGELPPPETRFRYSDEHLYALANFIYALKPPANPNQMDDRARRGQEVFEEEDCQRCHTPPLYTSNQLTPARGFKVPDALRETEDVHEKGVGTDPTLALTTRRGTGFYKVPSLLGVWYRGPFTHDGAISTLEEWFDPARERAGYVPTGWNLGKKERRIRGHRFGLKLSAEDKSALIAFLRTL